MEPSTMPPWLMPIIKAIATIIFTLFIYYFSASLKKLGVSTMDELNEGDSDVNDMLDSKETSFMNNFGWIAFIIIGIYIWSLMGVTMGQLGKTLRNYLPFNFGVFILVYFLFLRIPFGMGNKMVKRAYDFKKAPEKIIFIIAMLGFFTLAIFKYEWIPWILRWHL